MDQQDKIDEQEQVEFEEWARKKGYMLSVYPDVLDRCQYIHSATDDAWYAWQAARAPLLAKIAELRSDDRTIGFARWRSDGDGGRDLELCGIDDRGAFPIYADEFL